MECRISCFTVRSFGVINDQLTGNICRDYFGFDLPIAEVFNRWSVDPWGSAEGCQGVREQAVKNTNVIIK